MIKPISAIFVLLAALVLASCGRSYVPKPYGYYRLNLPEQQYQLYDCAGMPFRFELSESAHVQPMSGQNEGLWFDIVYPELRARINCT